MDFGSTPNGRDWCIKALHPADPLTEVRGLPDQSAVPTVMLNYQSTYTIEPSAGAADGWSFEGTLLPHPIAFVVARTHDSVLPDNPLLFMNTQLTGTTHKDKYVTFKTMCERWRLAYMSVTVYQDGPDLANQGTIVACQQVVEPRTFRMSCAPGTKGIEPPIASVEICAWQEEDLPSFNRCQAMPNAYFSRSRDGLYMPLHLTESCQVWSSDAHAITQTIVSTELGVNAWTALAWGENAQEPIRSWPLCYGPTAERLEPINMGNQSFEGQRTSAMLSAVMGHFCASNLSAQTRYSLFVRAGIEAQVNPRSVLSSQLTLAPPYDRRALEAYFAIARELKDAYPANYNDLGKIWDVISAGAKQALPYLTAVAPRVGKLATTAVGVGNAVRERRKEQKKKVKAKRTDLSQASIDKLKSQIAKQRPS